MLPFRFILGKLCLNSVCISLREIDLEWDVVIVRRRVKQNKKSFSKYNKIQDVLKIFFIVWL